MVQRRTVCVRSGPAGAKRSVEAPPPVLKVAGFTPTKSRVTPTLSTQLSLPERFVRERIPLTTGAVLAHLRRSAGVTVAVGIGEERSVGSAAGGVSLV